LRDAGDGLFGLKQFDQGVNQLRGNHPTTRKIVIVTSERITVSFLEFIFSPDSLMYHIEDV